MRFKLKINSIQKIQEIPAYWKEEDYRNLLMEFDVRDVEKLKLEELIEVFNMAVTDHEPDESAEIILRYKLGHKLSKGQIQNLSQEMLEDNESDENPDIELHYPLFNINRLLYTAYNGKFPAARATRLKMKLDFPENPDVAVTKETALLCLCRGLSDNSPVKRLYPAELMGKAEFSDAQKIIWELSGPENGEYILITSDYWISAEDIADEELEDQIKVFGTSED